MTSNFSEIFGKIQVDPKVDLLFKNAQVNSIDEPLKSTVTVVENVPSEGQSAAATFEKETRKQKIQKIIDENLKTVFVGNLGVDVVEKHQTKKLLQKFEVFGEISSIRFRSIVSK